MGATKSTGRTVGAYEAKTHLSRLLDEVAAGETITITKHGVPVAVLAPPPGAVRPDTAAAIGQLRELRQGARLGDLALRAMVEEGRR